jgi:hypothetical protein
LFPFRRILIADLSGSLDLGLLRYGARLASFSPSCVVGVAASLGEGVLGALAPAAHRLFDAQLREDLGCRVLTEPDPDDLFDEAATFGADVLLTRYGGGVGGMRLTRHLVEASPIPLWLAPEGANPSLRRVATEMALNNDNGVARLACAVGRSAGTEKLIAIHVNFSYILDQSVETLQRLREERAAELSWRMARMETGAMSYFVRVENSLYHARSLRRAAQEEQVDLLVTARLRPHWALPREQRLRLSGVPGRMAILAIPVDEPRPGKLAARRLAMNAPDPMWN